MVRAVFKCYFVRDKFFVFSILFLLLQGQEEEREKKWRTWVDERFVKVRGVLHLNFHKPKAVYYFVRRY